MTLSDVTYDKTVLTDPRFKTYRPYGSIVNAFYCKSQEILLQGPAGTGKSRGNLEKVHLLLTKYPGSRGLMVRKTRASLTQSTMVTFDRFVLPEDGQVRWRTQEQEYRYSNGSIFACGGMDKSSRILSTEYDFIYVPEVTELTEDEYEVLFTRCRFGHAPYNQILSDCNPDRPQHWVRRRADAGKMIDFPSKHTDNPVLWDQVLGAWTTQGEQYMEKLDALSGIRRKRMRDGIWASAEGMIYEDEWNASIHLENHFEPPKDWRRFWVVDFGFTNPFVFQAWAVDPDNTAYRFHEIYQSKLLVEDAAKQILSWRIWENEPLPEALICDWDAEGRATLEKYLEMSSVAADKNVLEGIEDVKVRLRPQANGKPGIVFLRDSLEDVDALLEEGGKPTKTEDEIEGYEWSDNAKKELPRKVDDHGMDCLRYFCRHLSGESASWSMGMGA